MLHAEAFFSLFSPKALPLWVLMPTDRLGAPRDHRRLSYGCVPAKKAYCDSNHVNEEIIQAAFPGNRVPFAGISHVNATYNGTKTIHASNVITDAMRHISVLIINTANTAAIIEKKIYRNGPDAKILPRPFVSRVAYLIVKRFCPHTKI